MDLPTYTNIWRIEKRLYKLYDFRLPMPLPIGQLAVFAAIAVPYVVLLTAGGLPFNHKLIWLYVLPPGLLTWLATRPVLESKRLPELIGSQLRYLAEPRVWCRMAPLAEKDVVVVTGRVWRLSRTGRRPAKALAAAPAVASVSRPRPWPTVPSRSWPAGLQAASSADLTGSAPGPRVPRIVGPPQAWPAGPPARLAGPAAGLAGPAAGLAGPAAGLAGPAAGLAGPAAGLAGPAAGLAGPAAGLAGPAAGLAGPAAGLAGPAAGLAGPAAGLAGPGQAAGSGAAGPPETSVGRRSQRPAVTVVGAGSSRAAPLAVERALAGPAAQRGDARHGRVLVVPGGHRPGKPDQLQRDRSRAQLPIAGPGRIVVLGCTVGAGQTITALLTGEVLASLREERVAVLDLNPGARSLAERALARPALNQAASLGPSRLEILGRGQVIDPGQDGQDGQDGGSAPDGGPADDARAFELASARYPLVLADPSTSAVPRLLAIADQLVLVAPASAAAAGAIAMTFEWLDAHGQASLSGAAIMVMNGVSRRTMPHVEQAERVAAGRCRAIVLVPWDDQLQNPAAKRPRPVAGSAAGQRGAGLHGTGQQGTGQHRTGQHWAGLLSPATAGAYTALAGVLVAALAGLPPPSSGRHGQSGQASR